MKLLIYLILSVTLVSCNQNKGGNSEQNTAEEDSKYDKFLKEPAYILNASGINKAYYDAYDEAMKLWDVPFKELYVGTSKGIAHVIVTGPADGEPLVLLHGMKASSTMWYPNIKALSEKHRVFAIDFILEPSKSHQYNTIATEDQVTAWYNEVLYALEIKRYHLIGASRGGYLATKIALKNPKRVKSLILLSPAQTLIWIRPSKDVFLLAASFFASKEDQLAQTLQSMSSNVPNIRKEFIKQHKIAYDFDSENKFVASMMPFTHKQLKKLKMPVLVLVGDKDLMNNEKSVAVANKLPKGKGEIVRNAGHFLSVDQPEVVNGKILEFLK